MRKEGSCILEVVGLPDKKLNETTTLVVSSHN
jgi:hypothetical protein